MLKAEDAHRTCSQSLIVAVVPPERETHVEIAAALEREPGDQALWTLVEYPDPVALSEVRKATGGCVVFLDFADPIRAKAVAAALDSSYPMATAVAVHAAKTASDLIEIMQLGIREVVTLPVVASDVVGAFARVIRKLRTPLGPDDEGGNLYAFCPQSRERARPRSRLTAAAAAARLTNQRMLLLD